MSTHYSNPKRENDPHALPDVWVTQLTAREVAQGMEDEIYEFMRRPEFKLASMNSKAQDAMYDAMIEELSIAGGWCWSYCQIGCLPDSSWFGPFDTEQAAVDDMRSQQDSDSDDSEEQS